MNFLPMRKAVFVIAFLLAGSALAEDAAKGKSVYESTCAACHGTGAAGAPKFGNKDAWGPRIKTGVESLYRSALNGKNVMPPRGGKPSLSDAEVKAAVDYMVSAASATENKPEVKEAAPVTAEVETPKPVAAVPAPVTKPAGSAGISFNRLLKKPAKKNPPPAEDGIHDPSNDGTLSLQPPLEVFESLPRTEFGNLVDWVAALGQNKISPRADRLDANANMIVMDLNIERQVKGSMPNVIYPHKQHTEWLDCANCHPAIFIPQKGANQISMAAILLGQKCGVCHGKVAFPVKSVTCAKCHSKPKDPSLQLTKSPTAAAATQ